MANINIRDKVWFTSKSRMQAENRYRRYESCWHILLCIVSIFIIGVSVFRDPFFFGFPVDQFNIIASVAILSITIVVFGFKFGEKAALHRECYLRLQELHVSDNPDDVVAVQYVNILSSYPNHDEIDYLAFVVKKVLFGEKNLKRPDGTDMVVSIAMFVEWAVLGALFWISLVLVLAMVCTPVLWLVWS